MTSWDDFEVMPPALLRSRQRFLWGKTLLAGVVFAAAAAAHFWYAWDPGSTAYALMLGPPIVVHGLLLSIVFGSRLVQHVEYRQHLKESLTRYPDEVEEMNLEDRRARLAQFTKFQQADLHAYEEKSAESLAAFKTSGSFFGVMVVVYIINILICQLENAPALVEELAVLSGTLLTIAVFIGVFVVLGNAQEMIEERLMTKLVGREQRTLRKLRTAIADEELTGALSEMRHDPDSAEGGLTQIP